MTTKEAFAQLIMRRNWYQGLDISKGAAHTIAKRFRDGELISTDKLEDILAMAGFKVIIEKQWASPGNNMAEQGATKTNILLTLGDTPEMINKK